MTSKVPCVDCRAMILPATAERTGGRCMPCSQGTRQDIERARAYYAEQRDRELHDPIVALWRSLVDRVHSGSNGFDGLTDAQKIYYAVNYLAGCAYRSGFHHYFLYEGARHFEVVLRGLVEIGASESLALIVAAKELLFAAAPIPADLDELHRLYDRIEGTALSDELELLCDRFNSHPDDIHGRLRSFALNAGLVTHDYVPSKAP